MSAFLVLLMVVALCFSVRWILVLTREVAALRDELQRARQDSIGWMRAAIGSGRRNPAPARLERSNVIQFPRVH